MVNPQIIARQRNDALDVAFLVVMRVQKDNNIAAVNLTYAVGHLVDKETVLVLKHR